MEKSVTSCLQQVRNHMRNWPDLLCLVACCDVPELLQGGLLVHVCSNTRVHEGKAKVSNFSHVISCSSPRSNHSCLGFTLAQESFGPLTKVQTNHHAPEFQQPCQCTSSYNEKHNGASFQPTWSNERGRATPSSTMRFRHVSISDTSGEIR